MATVNIVFSKVGVRGGDDAYPAYLSAGSVSEDITSSASSQVTIASATALAAEGQCVRITASGGNVRVKAGTSPTATVTDLLILDGTTFDWGISIGDKIAVIDG